MQPRYVPAVLLALCATIAPIAAQVGPDPARMVVVATAPACGVDPVPDAAGRLWARGESWKMSFAEGGARYFPRFPRAERHWPLALRLRALTVAGEPLRIEVGAPCAEGDERVVWTHGACDEVWDLRSDVVEQSFVIEQLSARGEVRLEVAIATELALAVADGRRLSWDLPGHGAVVCSDAVAVDAAGVRIPLELGWEQDAMVLTVPASFVAAAKLPLVVDPFLRSVVVDNTPEPMTSPRVAVDSRRGEWLVACTSVFSAPDRDVRVLRFDRDGALLERTFAESTIADVSVVDIGYQAGLDRLLVAWVEGSPGVVQRRFRNGGTTTYGATATVTFPSLDSVGRLAVGGGATGDAFAIVASGSATGLNNAVEVAVITTAGQRGTGTLFFGQGFFASEVAISSFGGDDGRWGIAYALADFARGIPDLTFQTLEDQTLGPLAVTSAPIVFRAGNISSRNLSITTVGTAFVVGWQENTPTHAMAQWFEAVTPGFFLPRGMVNLTEVERGAGTTASISGPVLAGSGCRVALAYRESGAVRMAAFRISAPLSTTAAVDEGQRTMAAGVPALGDVVLGIVPIGGLDSSRCFTVWELAVTAGQDDLNGALYDARSSGAMFATTTTACGGGVSAFAAAGTTSLGGRFEIRTVPTGVSLLVAGLPLATPVAACEVAACRRGVQLPALATVLGNAMAVNVPCDAALIGTVLAFQGIDLGAPGGCSAATAGVPFKVTDTIRATVR